MDDGYSGGVKMVALFFLSANLRETKRSEVGPCVARQWSPKGGMAIFCACNFFNADR